MKSKNRPRCLVVKRSPGTLKGLSSNPGSTFSLRFFSFLFFLFFFSFSFHVVFILGTTVLYIKLLLYIDHNFWLTNFLLHLTCRSPPSPSRGPAIYVFLVVRIIIRVIWLDFKNPGLVLSFLNESTSRRIATLNPVDTSILTFLTTKKKLLSWSTSSLWCLLLLVEI